MCAVLTAESGDIEKVAEIITECQRMKIPVLAPDINSSLKQFTLIKGEAQNGIPDVESIESRFDSSNRGSSMESGDPRFSYPDLRSGIENRDRIRFGLLTIKNLGENIADAIIAERKKNGPFKNIEDFARRIDHKDLNKKSLESLVKSGALDAFGERATLLANMEQLLYYSRENNKARSTGQVSLFDGPDAEVTLPPLRLTEVEAASRWDRLMWEKELLGLFISDHPLKDYQQQFDFEKGLVQIKDLANARSGGVKIGGMITRIQKIFTKQGKPMVFTMIEDLTGKVETVVFPNVLEQNPEAFAENKVVIISGRLNDRDGIPKLLCDSVRPIVPIFNPRQQVEI
jgi:DNA polymerase-3 subunit alpha